MTASAERLPRRQVLAYGLPGLVAALPVIPVAILMPAFYAGSAGLGFAAVGLALAAARLLDFFSDPLVGACADRFAWRGHRYKPWLVLGAVLAGVALWRLAFPPSGVTALYLWGWSVLLFTGWTALMIPYTAWGAELADGVHDRSRLTTSREVAGVIGMVAAVGAPLVLGTGPAASDGASAGAGIAAVAAVAITLGVPAILVMLIVVPEPAPGATRVGVRSRDLVRLFRFAPFRQTLGCWFLNGIANGLPAVLFPVMVSSWFGLDEQALHVLLVCYFGAAILGAPVWLWLAGRFGKVNAWSVAVVVNVIAFAHVLALGPGDALLYGVVCIVTGATLGADLALPASLQADVLESDRRVNDVRRSASAFALWSMATKLALAIAVGVAFVALGVSGPSTPASGATVAPPAGVLLGLYVVLPLAFKTAVLVLMRRIPELLDAADRDAPAQHREHAAEHRQLFVQTTGGVPEIDV